MRQAGTIANPQDAERFANYLVTLGISSKIDAAGDAWAVWVHDENQLAKSRQELEQFVKNPADPRYREAQGQAQRIRQQDERRVREVQKNYVDMRNQWASPWYRRQITLLLIAISVVASLSATAGVNLPFSYLRFDTSEIMAGQVWRLITPIFFHDTNNLFHLIFNMWWLYDLGTLIERTIGHFRYLALLLFVAIVSNVSQNIWMGPHFLGMSGVVYGLFGYAWIRGRLDPTSGLYLRPDIVFLMFLWLILCMAGVVGNVANGAHVGGLVAGVVWGALAYAINRQRPKA